MTARRAGILALLFVFLLVRLFWWYDEQPSTHVGRLVSAAGLLKIALWVIPAIAAVAILRRASLRGALGYIGLDGNLLTGLRFGLLATLPLAFAVALRPPERVDVVVLVGTALVGPLAEEILFRGFLLKTLLSEARWPVAWAIGVSAIAFGAAHVGGLDRRNVETFLWQLGTPDAALAQSRLLGGAMHTAVMGVGGVFFGWIVYRFGSLWPAIAFHACLNLWLTLAFGDRPEPGVDAVGVAHAASFAIAVLLTLRRRVVVRASSPVHLS